MTKSVLIRIIAGAVAVTAVVLIVTWQFGGFEGLSTNGVAALILGVTASMFLGIGLMVAVFISSRSGQDQASYDATAGHFKAQSRDHPAPGDSESNSSR